MSKPLRLNSAFTLIEIITVIIIIAVLAAIGLVSWHIQIEKEYANRAKDTLKSIWAAEKNLFVWKGIFSDDFKDLALDNPNLVDNYYDYKIDYTGTDLIIKATHKSKQPLQGFQIDEDGTITGF